MKKIKFIKNGLILSVFTMSLAFLTSNANATEWYQSNTGYWVDDSFGSSYCEWSYFSSDCRSGAVTIRKQ